MGAICKIHKIVLHLCWNDIHCFVNEFDELCKCRSDASAVLDSTLSKVCLLGIHLWFSSHIHCLSRWFHVWFRVSITVARKPDDMGSLQLSTPTASHNGSACCFSSSFVCLSRWFHVWFRVSITVARKPDDCQVRTWDLNMGSLQLSTPTASHNGSACCFSSSFVKLNHVYFEKHYYFIFKNTCFEQMGQYYEQIKIHSGFPRFDTG